MRLSPRQRQILKLRCDGLTNLATGRALGITEASVKNHVTSIYDRLGVGSIGPACVLFARESLETREPNPDVLRPEDLSERPPERADWI